MQLAIHCLTRRSRNVQSIIKCNRFHSSIIDTNTTKSYAAPYVPVTDFYNGKSVLVTGATGFLGMVLVEKLLYTCTGIEKVYMLVREKKGVPPEQRLIQFLNDPLFQRLKEDKPTFLRKLVPVTGDISVPGLGIRDEDIKTLADEVSIVFHSAASVKFNDKLSATLNINFRGTERVLDLSKKMKNLEAFVHMSTAYSNVTKNNSPIREVLYPEPASLQEVEDFVAKYDNDEKMTQKIVGERANTYTFAKSLTEHYLLKNKGDVPVTIVRPAAVTPISDGPLPGWLNGWQGVTLAVYNAGMGHSRVAPGNHENLIDFIPVDYVANFSIIVAAQNKGTKDLPIYNCSSSPVNPITWSRAFELYSENTVKKGRNYLPFPHTFFVESKIMLWILTVLLEVIPSYVADMWLRITGREAKYMKIHKKQMALRQVMDFFMENSWVIDNSNVMALINKLSEEDRKLFPCNPADIDWRKYMHLFSEGIDKFLIKKSSGN